MVRYKRQIVFALLLCLLMACIAGCWDNIEIEDRAFVLGIALDKGKKSGDIKMTYQIAIPAAMGAKEGGAGGGKAYVNISAEGPDFMTVDRLIESRVDRVRNFEHIQVIIIGEAMAREGIGKMIDPFVRNNQMRRRTYVLVAPGDAAPLFDIKPPLSPTTSQHLSALITDNEDRTLNILAATDIGKLALDNRRKLDYVLAGVAIKDNQLAVSGTGVFRHNRLIGWLNDAETGAVKLLQGHIAKGIFTMPSPDPRAGLLALKIYEGNYSVKPEIKGDKVTFKVKLSMDGDIAEIQNREFDTFDDAYLLAVGNAADRYLTNYCQRVFRKAQNEYDTEIFGFGRAVRNYDFAFWEKNKDRAHELFKKSELDIDVKFEVRRTGLVR